MKPIGPLMIEHRLIERMIKLLRDELTEIEDGKSVDLELILSGIDFLVNYADRTHHGKEEDILFSELAKKPLSDEHRRMINALLKEHDQARDNVRGLNEACVKHSRGDKTAINEITDRLRVISDLYPKHITKEDREFFVPAMDYLTLMEQEKMLADFRAFDENMIHEKYRKIVEKYE